MVGIKRVVVAVRSMEDALAFYRDALGLTVIYEQTLIDKELHIVRLAVGEMEIELLQPTSETGPVARFVDQHGEGLHHLVLGTDDIELDMRTLLARGAELIDREPRQGPDGKVAFISPRSTGGVLIELSDSAQGPAPTIKPPEEPS